jgi:antitoxin component HigA of HigAB toxin-antitoxin module
LSYIIISDKELSMKENVAAILDGDVDSFRLVQQELAIMKVASLIRNLMQERKVTNADLARKLGKDPGYVSRVLAGKMNLTLSTVADILWALDSSLEVVTKPIDPREIPAHLVRRPEWSQGWEEAAAPSFWSRGASSEGSAS